MGYYINHTKEGGLEPIGKVTRLVKDCTAQIISEPKSLEDYPNKAVICVIDNRIFEAAGLAFSESELNEFKRIDGRKKTWLLMDKQLAHELAHYTVVS